MNPTKIALIIVLILVLFLLCNKIRRWIRKLKWNWKYRDQLTVLANRDFTQMASVILEGCGGKNNIVAIDNCITRLRLEVRDRLLVDESVIKSSGASGVIRPGKTSIQVIIGPGVQSVADEFKKLCK